MKQLTVVLFRQIQFGQNNFRALEKALNRDRSIIHDSRDEARTFQLNTAEADWTMSAAISRFYSEIKLKTVSVRTQR